MGLFNGIDRSATILKPVQSPAIRVAKRIANVVVMAVGFLQRRLNCEADSLSSNSPSQELPVARVYVDRVPKNDQIDDEALRSELVHLALEFPDS